MTALPPATTDAVKLTTVPELTLVAALPPDVTVNWVVLAVGVCARSVDGVQQVGIAVARRKTRNRARRLCAPPPSEGLAAGQEEHERDMLSGSSVRGK